jgi:aspartyl-tRNA(Asn)/glutamyl-tRNA(Gln) amidotransferase subunit B
MNKKMLFKVLIGLEIHVELKTKSKMFCRCSTDYFGHLPNSYVCPVCLGLPGALPYPNQKAIEAVVLAGLALNCQIANFSKFDRKNYFYPDLPKGYQISQYDLPLCQKGEFEKVKIIRVHLEEDTGKLIHGVVNNKKASLIDFNRSGIPLMEIVTEPNLCSASQTKDFLKKLQQLVRCLGIADADMEKGQMRCEPTVNLEIEKNGKKYYTPLVEIKNINSFRFAEKAIEYEIKRQFEEFKKTGFEKQTGNKSTRGWDDKEQKTVLQREKEEAADYRYFPEPDIPPIRLSNEQIKEIKAKIPELPQEKIINLKKIGLSNYQAELLSRTDKNIKVLEDSLKISEKLKVKINPSKATDLIINKKVKTAQEIIDKLSNKKPGMDKNELVLMIGNVIKDNPLVVEQFKKGKETVVEFLVGQVMARTKGQAVPQEVRKLFREKLKSA